MPDIRSVPYYRPLVINIVSIQLLGCDLITIESIVGALFISFFRTFTFAVRYFCYTLKMVFSDRLQFNFMRIDLKIIQFGHQMTKQMIGFWLKYVLVHLTET